MKVILISNNGKKHYKFSFGKWMYIVLFAVTFVLTVYFIGHYDQFFNRNALTSGDVKIINRFDSYLRRLATLEAQIQRLNALGARIAKKNNIDTDSFLLKKDPARGGAVDFRISEEVTILAEKDLIKSIKEAENVLIEKERIFKYYRDAKIIKKKKEHLHASSSIYDSPVKIGYISSSYGSRRDPINGRHRFHKGVDIAARTGTPINTIASGFVSFTGWKGGYGKVIEIIHSNTLKSRYAHLSKISVHKGQVVRKGDFIAKMGATGRVTGPHLHLEVWKNHKAINPNVYLKEALNNIKSR